MEFKNVLRANRLKATPKRLAILKLLKEEQKYLSPREIRDLLKKNSFSIGLPTVYRILQECHSLQLLEVFVSPETQVNYFYVKQDLQGKSHHFLCTNCKQVKSIKNDLFPAILATIKSTLNVQMRHHYQVTTGLCNNCK
jgi:Fe2+ or Zn2+ uptake regulation protein